MSKLIDDAVEFERANPEQLANWLLWQIQCLDGDPEGANIVRHLDFEREEILSRH